VVRASLVEVLGSVVVQAESQRSGFTPGFASRLWLADGRTAFVKAVNSRRSWLVESYGLEAANLELIPAVVSAPRVRRRLDLTDGDTGWLILIFDDVSGRPPTRPWKWEEADRVLAAVRQLSVALTPARPWKGFVDDSFPIRVVCSTRSYREDCCPTLPADCESSACRLSTACGAIRWSTRTYGMTT
jgi:hypothetical protein